MEGGNFRAQEYEGRLLSGLGFVRGGHFQGSGLDLGGGGQLSGLKYVREGTFRARVCEGRSQQVSSGLGGDARPRHLKGGHFLGSCM